MKALWVGFALRLVDLCCAGFSKEQGCSRAHHLRKRRKEMSENGGGKVKRAKGRVCDQEMGLVMEGEGKDRYPCTRYEEEEAAAAALQVDKLRKTEQAQG